MDNTADTTPRSDEDRTLAVPTHRLATRRKALLWFGAGGAALAVAACSPDSNSAGEGATSTSTTTGATSTSTTAATGATSTTAAASGALTAIPEETAGPYPGDGSNGPNVLTDDAVVRSDITTSFGSYTGTAAGVPLTIKLRVLDANNSAPLEGAAVYLWHCDIDGEYSLYTISDQNYLRGVQAADANGDVTFTSIYPACYSGRWPHIHFEVYPDLASISSARNKVATSQLALPASASDVVYATDGYETSISNASRVTLASDNVFSDGATQETPTVTGSVANGYTASLTVAV